jgi:hypothetical protein
VQLERRHTFSAVQDVNTAARAAAAVAAAPPARCGDASTPARTPDGDRAANACPSHALSTFGSDFVDGTVAVVAAPSGGAPDAEQAAAAAADAALVTSASSLSPAASLATGGGCGGLAVPEHAPLQRAAAVTSPGPSLTYRELLALWSASNRQQQAKQRTGSSGGAAAAAAAAAAGGGVGGTAHA